MPRTDAWCSRVSVRKYHAYVTEAFSNGAYLTCSAMRLFDYDAFTLLDADRAYCSAPQFDTDVALPFYPIKNRRSLRSRIRTRSSNRSELPSRI